MTEITRYADEADERRGLDISNTVWPHDRIGIEEARSFRSSLLDHVDLLARIDGYVGGSAIGAIEPSWPEVVSALITVLPEQRNRGAGTGFYEAISTWARARDLDTIESVVADNDPESLAFAERRGFAVDRLEKGLSLDLTMIDSPDVKPPQGVEIVPWIERPELVDGMFEVVLEAAPDIPGVRTNSSSPSRTGSRTTCRPRATGRKRPSWPWPVRR